MCEPDHNSTMESQSIFAHGHPYILLYISTEIAISVIMLMHAPTLAMCCSHFRQVFRVTLAHGTETLVKEFLLVSLLCFKCVNSLLM